MLLCWQLQVTMTMWFRTLARALGFMAWTCRRQNPGTAGAYQGMIRWAFFIIQ